MKVGAERREALREALERSGAERRESKGSGELWRYTLDGAHVTLWRTGTVRVSGKGEYLDVVQRLVEEFALPDEVAETQIPADLPRDAPWAGVDESGKGDYFGPLVSAAVVVTPHAAAELAAAGVQDSKRLTDKRVAKLAPLIRELAQYEVTTLEPERYNDYYAQAREQGMRLNQVLAWAHVESLRALLARDVGFAYAIVDQFADKRVVETAAAPHTGDLRIVQFHRAEADIAVAAASVLARKGFIDWLERESIARGIELPRGAWDRAIDAARELVARDGEDVLRKVAKLHFATTGKVIGP
jgi:ribonuclease HIII